MVSLLRQLAFRIKVNCLCCQKCCQQGWFLMVLLCVNIVIAVQLSLFSISWPNIVSHTQITIYKRHPFYPGSSFGGTREIQNFLNDLLSLAGVFYLINSDGTPWSAVRLPGPPSKRRGRAVFRQAGVGPPVRPCGAGANPSQAAIFSPSTYLPVCVQYNTDWSEDGPSKSRGRAVFRQAGVGPPVRPCGAGANPSQAAIVSPSTYLPVCVQYNTDWLEDGTTRGLTADGTRGLPADGPTIGLPAMALFELKVINKGCGPTGAMAPEEPITTGCSTTFRD